MYCEDCKFANWEYKLFNGYVKRNFSTIPLYYSEQFDCYCKKHNKFFLESEIDGKCNDAEYGENNYSKICKLYYKQIDKYNDILAEFRKTINDDILINSYEEFDLFIEYLKTHYPEMYNEIQD